MGFGTREVICSAGSYDVHQQQLTGIQKVELFWRRFSHERHAELSAAFGAIILSVRYRLCRHNVIAAAI